MHVIFAGYSVLVSRSSQQFSKLFNIIKVNSMLIRGLSTKHVQQHKEKSETISDLMKTKSEDEIFETLRSEHIKNSTS